MFGITLRTQDPAKPFWALVDKASAFETAPSIRALGYFPHITLARCPAIGTSSLAAAAEALAGEPAFALTFERIEFFDTEPLVLWLNPSLDQRLIEAHARLHARVDPALCDPHYLAEHWRPHLTIAMAIGGTQRESAFDFAKRPFAPFTLTFDVADCLSWPPVSILQTRTLDQEPA
ncbi:2'-5' RNA ligase family protein [Bosea sp. 2YAB26]|uniref:2'-5' RNA ligase family protein n=1 Tax=Bosea sp. 2YAB26 TaxID=3237478 RepID=UPI003F8F81E0